MRESFMHLESTFTHILPFHKNDLFLFMVVKTKWIDGSTSVSTVRQTYLNIIKCITREVNIFRPVSTIWRPHFSKQAQVHEKKCPTKLKSSGNTKRLNLPRQEI